MYSYYVLVTLKYYKVKERLQSMHFNVMILYFCYSKFWC